jgi:hypothetical protein
MMSNQLKDKSLKMLTSLQAPNKKIDFGSNTTTVYDKEKEETKIL